MTQLLKTYFTRQASMRKVLISLIPIIILGVYLFGLRVLALLLVNSVFAVLAEFVMSKRRGDKISEAVFVTSILYTLTLPVTFPFWMSAVGICFGIIFAKEVFGGFGRNIFNPALVARCFVYIAFAVPMTAAWTLPFSGSFNGFVSWVSYDIVSGGTPLALLRNKVVQGFEFREFMKFFFGGTSGSIGETSVLLILLSSIYLVKSKVASLKIILSTMISFIIFNLILNLAGVDKVPPVYYSFFAGGIAFSAVFMATDPVTAPKTEIGKLMYGTLIGILTVVIRAFAVFPGGVMFSILIANTFVPLIDMGVKALQKGGNPK